MGSLRAQLTLWYGGVLALALVVLSLSAYFAAARLLTQRMDSSLLSTMDEAERSLRQPAVDTESPSEFALRALQSLHYPIRTIWVLDTEGRLLAEKKAATGSPLRHPQGLTAGAGAPHFYQFAESRVDADDSCRGVFKRVTVPAGASYLIVVAQSTESIEDQLDLLRDVSFIVVPFAVVLAAAGGWFLAHRSLAPVSAMADSAKQITARNLEERMPVPNPGNEVGSLATTFNQLLDRLSTAITQQRQFMADASHELRTPLSVMRTAAEITLERSSRDESDYREALNVVKQQTGRLTQIVNDMFALARADMGQLSLHPVDLYLDEVANEALRAAAVLAKRKKIDLESQIGGEAPYRGDEGLLRQMVLNLLDNAIKYTMPGGHVKLGLEARTTEYAIQVTDTGPGIPSEDQPRIFDRFFRSDKARTGQNSVENGTGLGLSIARSIAELHGGQLNLQRSDSSGSAFIALLPRR
jgi:heavy metal sensor kinase